MPMVPEAAIAMLACARIGAIHSVVFGGFGGEGTRDPHRRLPPQGHRLGLLRHRGGEGHPYKPAARRGRSTLPWSKPEACVILQRTQVEASLVPGRDHDWAAFVARARAAAARRTACRSRRDRSTLRALHLRHDRQAQGRRARQWRPHGRAGLVDDQPLRREAGRGLLGGLRRRLGGRPFLHRLRAASRRHHLHPLRGQAGRHARSRAYWRVIAQHGVAALFTAPTAFRAIKKKIRRRSISPATRCRASARCSSPVNAPIPTRWSGRRRSSACRSSITGGRPRPAGASSAIRRPRPAAGEARLADRADARLRRAHRR